MARLVIEGGNPLMGAVRLGGAKNAGFKLMIAASLGEGESRILNLSYISDVENTQAILKKIGVKVKKCGERTVFIEANGLKMSQLPKLEGKKTRAATLFAAMLLARSGKAIIPLPGGCVLGTRPVNRHLEALKSLGAKVSYQGENIHITGKNLKGTTFRFDKKTHTGTEAMIIVAAKAKGRTVIENAGQEPEIDDLIEFLNKMGGEIKRGPGEEIIINGVKKLGGAIHQVMPDRNEAISYAVAALATKGDIVLENAKKSHLKAFLEKLDEIGAKFETNKFGMRFWYEKQLKATNIETQPAPGFMTDWQPLWTILMTQAKGISQVIERVHNNRFQYCHELEKMGAKIKLFNPEVRNLKKYYEFDNPETDKNLHAAKITGPTPLKGANLKVTDLRAGATLVMAALIAKGKSTLENISHIDRGYEKLDEKLRQLGANIKRVK
ncbi:UDP-N-acetylglucosamine 1-carboxyvinyltransferase [Candidatus Beckwithbacteria bacterium CG10_big_fil_rev_8_21_14_0_10_34_10]|uniref:UDP-N-acetylglucosamine 1-carboxyvinyltransferase n=1 Tax=Candidatus Beckwithbacteria bacterium CG10_big_fil_rev_8_21_14_0_10_34_10 TaxID=1974495 RepID=A0A2H0W907_9BACT|nr:MAG: UDP-N-acetylglucosamine 1-carboxyvinyltransferase [Candidatus Beckwithbacteria bacterium CG10_big_fil_rev_8_21_14_0_10_34_10]